MHVIAAILHATMVSTDDPNAEAWDVVHYVRAMRRDLATNGTAIDTFGRPTVDCLPVIDTIDVDAFVSDDGAADGAA
jgi:hypothetical protein